MNANKILIVDDDYTIRRFLATLLSDRGYEVHEAEDGEQGFKLAGSIRPDREPPTRSFSTSARTAWPG